MTALIEVPEVDLGTLTIGLTAADTLFLQAHTAYAFTDEPVTDAQLATIHELVRQAPTSMNSQPLRVTFVRGAAKERLVAHLSEGNKAKTQSAPVAAILSYDVDFHEELPKLLPQNPQAQGFFPEEGPRAEFAKMNASIQVGYFILAARAVGLDAGPMGGFDSAGVDAEFFTGTAHRSLVVVNLGHVAEGGTFPRNPRLAFEEQVEVLSE